MGSIPGLYGSEVNRVRATVNHVIEVADGAWQVECGYDY